MKNLQYYLELPYTMIMRRDEDGDYVARIDELPGCAAHGTTPQEAFEALEEAKQLWITDCLESGDPVPEPAPEEAALPSGKWVQRVSRTLHQKLVSLAKRENVSLNQFVASLLAEAVGARRAARSDHYYRIGEHVCIYGFVNTSHALRMDMAHNIGISLVARTGLRELHSMAEGILVVDSSGTKISATTRGDHWITIQPPSEEVMAHG